MKVYVLQNIKLPNIKLHVFMCRHPEEQQIHLSNLRIRDYTFMEFQNVFSFLS